MKINNSYSARASDAPRAAMSPVHLKHETKSHMEKIKMKIRVYKVRIINEFEKNP